MSYNFAKGVNLTENSLVLMACHPFTFGGNITSSEIQNIRECGFNVVRLGDSSSKHISKMMDNVSGSEFSTIEGSDFYAVIETDNKDAISAYQAFIDKYKSRPNLLGWSIGDATSLEDVEGWIEKVHIIRSRTNNQPIFLNMPNENMKSFVLTNNYDSFLNAVKSKLSPKVWVSTFFGVCDVDGKNDIDPKYYKCLSSFSRVVSENTDSVFLATCRCVGIKSTEYWRNYLSPTKATMMFEVFSALAYGAQGIVFYGYSLPENIGKESDEKYTIYFDAPITSIGIKDHLVWEDLKEVLTMIHKYEDVFKNSKMIRSVHSGNFVSDIVDKPTYPFGPVKFLKTISNKGVLMSLLQTTKVKAVSINGKPNEVKVTENYFVVVNQDLEEKQVLSISFNPGYDITEITPTVLPQRTRNIYLNDELSHVLVTKSLAPGGFAIYKYSESVQ